MLRVLMLMTDLQRGGLPLRMVRLATRLPEVGVQPVVGCLAPAGPLSAELDSAGIETFSCDARGSFDLTCLARLAGHIRRSAPDLIHSSLFHANLAARLVGRLDRPRPIITSTVTVEIERRWHCWIEALTGGLSSLHTANSTAVADHLSTDLGFAPDKLTVIPNGLDIEAIDAAPAVERRAFGIEEGIPLIVWAGRMDPIKDLETLVRVMARLHKQLPVRAVLLGDGPQRPRIQAMIRELGLESVIVMALWSDNVAGWLKAADALLFPSHTEGSPNVVLEAMLCGCAVVASDLPAIRELIDSDRHGLLCRRADVSGFTASVAALLLDARRRQRLTEAARERTCQEHDLQHVVHLWRATYDRVLSASAAG